MRPCGTFSRPEPSLASRVVRLEGLLNEQYSEILEAVTELHSRLDRQYSYLQLLEGRVRLLQVAIQNVICRADSTDSDFGPQDFDLHSLD